MKVAHLLFISWLPRLTSLDAVDELTGSPCEKQSCLHGGTCQAINATTWSCKCLPSFTGQNCETSLHIPQFPHKKCFLDEKQCFVTNGTVADWKTAQQICTQNASQTLPVITNEVIQKQFHSFLKSGPLSLQNSSIWLDLHTRQVDSKPTAQWYWLNGNRSALTVAPECPGCNSWTSALCKASSNLHVAAMAQSWTLKTCYLCKVVTASLCRTSIFNGSIASFELESACYVLYGRYYGASWFEAVNLCIHHGAVLADFTDNVLKHYHTTYLCPSTVGPSTCVWIGLIKPWFVWSSQHNAAVAYNRFNTTHHLQIQDFKPPWQPVGQIAEEQVNYSVVARYNAQYWNVSLHSEHHLVVCHNEIFPCTDGLNNCSKFADCISANGSYLCRCHPGFTGNGTHCEPAHSCMPADICGVHGQCIDTGGSYFCDCDFGYQFNGSTCVARGRMCDIECSSLAKCIYTGTTYRCVCKPGTVGDGLACEDINECTNTSICPVYANCTNLAPGYRCDCLSGFVSYPVTDSLVEFNKLLQRSFLGSGMYCNDVDECEVNHGNCSDRADCINTLGSYYCKCRTGFTGSGFKCHDIDDCIYQAPCSPHAVCHNTIGSFYCVCNKGFTGNGLSCTDVDECLGKNNGHCVANATCVNTIGSFHCMCSPGFTGNSYDNCTEIDECLSHPCRNNATCIDLVNGYKCICPHAYNGTLCEKGPLNCTANYVLRRCMPLFYDQINWRTFVINASVHSYAKTCNQPLNDIIKCLKGLVCRLPSYLFGILQALLVFCSKDSGKYPEHRDCLMKVDAKLDCFSVYPQMIFYALYWLLEPRLDSHLHNAHLQFDKLRLLQYGLSHHLTLSRAFHCRRMKLHETCGRKVADWQSKFSVALSRVAPRILDTVYHPDGFQELRIADCLQLPEGDPARKAAETIKLCTAVLVTMSASTQFGIVSLTDAEHRRVCRLSPHEYAHVCYPFVADSFSIVDIYVVGPTKAVHDIACGERRSEYIKYKLCLRQAARSSFLWQCADIVRSTYEAVYTSHHLTSEVHSLDVACNGIVRYLDCLRTVVTSVCGEETAEWQLNITRMMLADVLFDGYCQLGVEDALRKLKASSGHHLLPSASCVIMLLAVSFLSLAVSIQTTEASSYAKSTGLIVILQQLLTLRDYCSGW